MGFGLLFFACFLTYFGSLTPLGTYTFVLGSAIMLYALYKLSGQNKMFLCSAIGTAILLLDSMVVVICDVFGFVDTFYKVIFGIQSLVAPLLILLMLSAIFLLAKEVELRKIQAWCIVDASFVLIYLICDIVSAFVGSTAVIARLGLVCIISQVLYSMLLLVILFNCYARICYADDKEMDKNATGMPIFDFLNKLFNKASDKGRKNGPSEKGDK